MTQTPTNETNRRPLNVALPAHTVELIDEERELADELGVPVYAANLNDQ